MTRRSSSARSRRVGRNQVAKLWGFTRRSECSRILSQRFIEQIYPLPQFPPTWKCCGNPPRHRRDVFLCRIGLMSRDAPRVTASHECTHELHGRSREGVLPNRNVGSKRKLNKPFTQISQIIHSFSTGDYLVDSGKNCKTAFLNRDRIAKPCQRRPVDSEFCLSGRENS